MSSNDPARRVRRSLLAVLLLGAASGLGAWFVAARPRPTPTVPDARPVARLAGPSATGAPVAASGPLPASAVAMAASASVVQDDKARCGFDQVPEATDPPPDPDGAVRELPTIAKPGGVGYAGAQRRADAALRSTGDPFDAAVADALNVGDLRSLDDRLVTLERDAAQADDPRIYEIAFSACAGVGAQVVFGYRNVPVAGPRGIEACARLDPRRWAGHDPGNAVPWVYALSRADEVGDVAAQHEAFAQIAAATRYDRRFGMASAAIARVPPAGDADLAGISALMLNATAFALPPPMNVVTVRCADQAHGDAALATDCERISSVLGRSQDPNGRVLGGMIHKLATGDGRRLESLRKERAELMSRWSAAAVPRADVEKSPCSAARYLRRHFALVAQQGERGAMLQELAAGAAP